MTDLLLYPAANHPTHESLRIGLLLALSGGLMDAYTFLCRGGVFANAETGNLVRLGICLAQRDWSGGLQFAFPILAFAFGVLMADLFQQQCGQGALHLTWRQLILVLECGVLILVSLLPLDALANVLVAFVSAVQMQSFRSFRGNAGGTTMCTGNLRSGTHNLFCFLTARSPDSLRSSLAYYSIILAFTLGALLGGLVDPLLGERAILLCVFPLSLACLLMFSKQV